MTEAAAIRYLISKGWLMLDDGWFFLRGVCNEPLCVEGAYHLQQKMDRVAA